jgi:hypothetical protein
MGVKIRQRCAFPPRSLKRRGKGRGNGSTLLGRLQSRKNGHGQNQKRQDGANVSCAILDKGCGVTAGRCGRTCRVVFASFIRSAYRIIHVTNWAGDDRNPFSLRGDGAARNSGILRLGAAAQSDAAVHDAAASQHHKLPLVTAIASRPPRGIPAPRAWRESRGGRGKRRGQGGWPEEESSDAEQIRRHSIDGCFDPGRVGGDGLPEKAGGCARRVRAAGSARADGDCAMAPVAQSSEYVATIKSRRSTTLMPQVSGLLTEIRVHSGDHVKAGQVLMRSTRGSNRRRWIPRATERQKKALFDYDTIEEDRQQKLFDAGVTSRDTYEQAQQAFENAKADYESAVEARKSRNSCWTTTPSARRSTAWWAIFRCTLATTFLRRSPATVLTTVDENNHLEAYVYIPTERAAEVRMGLASNLTDNNGKLLEKTRSISSRPKWTARCRGFW